MESSARTKKAVEPAGEFPAIVGEPARRRACMYVGESKGRVAGGMGAGAVGGGNDYTMWVVCGRGGGSLREWRMSEALRL